MNLKAVLSGLVLKLQAHFTFTRQKGKKRRKEPRPLDSLNSDGFQLACFIVTDVFTLHLPDLCLRIHRTLPSFPCSPKTVLRLSRNTLRSISLAPPLEFGFPTSRQPIIQDSFLPCKLNKDPTSRPSFPLSPTSTLHGE